jgi:hypothetical protein
MRWTWALSLVLLVACSASGSAPRPAPPLAAAGAFFILSVGDVRDPYAPASSVTTPGAGNRFVAVRMGLTNSGSQPADYNVLNAKLRDTAGVEYQGQPAAGEAGPLQDGTLQPGETVLGWALFEMPQAGKPAAVSYGSTTVTLP